MKNIILLTALLTALGQQCFALHKYEPPAGHVLIGGGTEYGSFDSYVSAINPATPVIVSNYEYISQSDFSAGGSAETELDGYISGHSFYLVPLVSLAMTGAYSGVGTTTGIDDQVAAGTWDAQIHAFNAMCKRIGRPMYVRIGPEFNGSWEGYHVADFATAWKRIVDLSRADGVTNVAWVWDANTGGNADYMDYYPGDSYVDWWGLNMLGPEYFGTSETNSFMSDSLSHGMPVMICESGYDLSSNNFSQFLLPLFNFIAGNPQVKAWVYVNLNWNQYGSSNQDQNLQDYPSILQQFNAKINSDSRYISSRTQSQVLLELSGQDGGATNGGSASSAYSGPTSAVAGSTITLSGSGSSQFGTVQTYRWVFVSGPVYPKFTSSPLGTSSTVTFPVPGAYSMAFIVTDNQGATSQTAFTVNVSAAGQPSKTATYTISYSKPSSAVTAAAVSATDGNGNTTSGICGPSTCSISIDKAQGGYAVLQINYLNSSGNIVGSTGQMILPLQ